MKNPTLKLPNKYLVTQELALANGWIWRLEYLASIDYDTVVFLRNYWRKIKNRLIKSSHVEPAWLNQVTRNETFWQTLLMDDEEKELTEIRLMLI